MLWEELIMLTAKNYTYKSEFWDFSAAQQRIKNTLLAIHIKTKGPMLAHFISPFNPLSNSKFPLVNYAECQRPFSEIISYLKNFNFSFGLIVQI